MNYPWLNEYLLAKPGAQKDYKEEWEWWRWQVGGKMYAATCCPAANHKDYAGRTLLTLKCEPMQADMLRREYPDILPGFYMDKRNWISVDLNGAVPEEILKALCDQAYALVFAKLTKKLQREIAENAAE